MLKTFWRISLSRSKKHFRCCSLKTFTFSKVCYQPNRVLLSRPTFLLARPSQHVFLVPIIPWIEEAGGSILHVALTLWSVRWPHHFKLNWRSDYLLCGSKWTMIVGLVWEQGSSSMLSCFLVQRSKFVAQCIKQDKIIIKNLSAT